MFVVHSDCGVPQYDDRLFKYDSFLPFCKHNVWQIRGDNDPDRAYGPVLGSLFPSHAAFTRQLLERQVNSIVWLHESSQQEHLPSLEHAPSSS